ncbi:MAG: hypothetical protein V3V08_10605 [Nannocystaceae bacterium]
MQGHAVARKNPRLSCQRTVVEVLRQRDLGQQARTGDALFDDLRRCRRRDDVPLAVGPRLAHVLDDVKIAGHVFEHLRA